MSGRAGAGGERREVNGRCETRVNNSGTGVSAAIEAGTVLRTRKVLRIIRRPRGRKTRGVAPGGAVRGPAQLRVETGDGRRQGNCCRFGDRQEAVKQTNGKVCFQVPREGKLRSRTGLSCEVAEANQQAWLHPHFYALVGGIESVSTFCRFKSRKQGEEHVKTSPFACFCRFFIHILFTFVYLLIFVHSVSDSVCQFPRWSTS